MSMKNKATLIWLSLIMMIGYGLLIMYSMSDFNKQVIWYACGAAIALLIALFCQRFVMNVCDLLIRRGYAFYAVGVVGILLLHSDLSVTGNGARRWLGVGELSIIRPEEWLVFFTLISVAISIKASEEQQEKIWDICLEGIIEEDMEDEKKDVNEKINCSKCLILLKAFLADYGSIIFPIISTILIIKTDGFIASYMSVIIIGLFANVHRIKKPVKRFVATVLWMVFEVVASIFSEDFFYHYYFLRDGLAEFQIDLRMDIVKSGGLIGSGFGTSQYKLSQLFAPTESIYTVVCEELGLIGAITIVLLFLVLIVVIFKISKECHGYKDVFGEYYSLLVGVHFTFVLVMSIVGWRFYLPAPCIPFFSYGEELTTYILHVAEIALVLCVTKRNGTICMGNDKVIDLKQYIYDRNYYGLSKKENGL